MNLFQELKIAWKTKSAAEDIYKGATKMNGTTPGWKTSEFYLNLATQIATLWGAVSGFIPPKWAAIISTAGVAVYTVARTIVKAISDVKSAQSTTAAPATAVTVNTTAS